jgi:hypothetical protein
MKKIIIILIVVILVGLGAFLWQHLTPDETADWQTYRAENDKWEVKYPKGWVFEGEGNLIWFHPEGGPPTIFVMSHELVLEEETKCVPPFLEDFGLRIAGQEKINGKKFCKIFVEGDGEILQTYYNLIKKNDKIGDIGDTVYDIGFNHPDEGKLIILKQMLSTFKSLD